jgi:ribonuclease HII
MKQTPDLYEIERGLHEKGISLVCGVDEAGRGPLAGPVAAAAVILPDGLVIEGLNDSKKLTEKKREQLYDVITREALCWAVGLASEQEIDEVNILQATYLAMRRAVLQLSQIPSYVLVDGNRNPMLGLPTTTLVGGDGKAACIAAASVLAKVTRDRMMLDYDKQYPGYGFAKHKGYGTKAHYQAILELGMSPIHRRTFLKNLEEKR